MSNYIFRTDNDATLKRVQEEYEFIGRECRITGPGELTVFDRPQPKPKRTEDETKPQRFSKREREEGVIPRD